jgi:carboxypeptidase Q
MNRPLCLSLSLALLISGTIAAQSDSAFNAAIMEEGMAHGRAYEDLRYLCKNIGPRLSGSQNAAKAVEWGKKLMEEYGFDRVYLQPVMVPHWERGKTEQAEATAAGRKKALRVKSLGGSVGTNGTAVKGEVVEVKSFVELEQLGKEKLKGKIIFFNRPMDPRFKDTFRAYSTAVDQRGDGAWQAARYGAAGVIVRSMTLRRDNNPHTGSVRYQDSIPKIPAMAVSTEDADWLSASLKQYPNTSVTFSLSAQWFPDALSYNVIGELTGTEKNDEIISVGGHLDSWDVGEGAHDDGAGSVQSIEALRILKKLGYKPRHTIRAVLFMNEENGLRGGLGYAFKSDSLKEKHVLALESDRGGFSPTAFSIDGKSERVAYFKQFLPYLELFGIEDIYPGYGGADIGPLKKFYPEIILAGTVPDSQRYFDYHHADTDTFEAVNERELSLGASAMAAFLFFADKNL